MEAAATIIDLRRASAREPKACSHANETDAKRAAEKIRERECKARSRANQTDAKRVRDREDQGALFVGANSSYCDVCNAKKDAKWKVVLQRHPQSLLISLRRTLWDKVKGLHKDSRRVEFPIELDASDLLDVGNKKSFDEDFDSCHYTLSAVVSHIGSSPFLGHYIAYARNPTGWFLFNDSSVMPDEGFH